MQEILTRAPNVYQSAAENSPTVPKTLFTLFLQCSENTNNFCFVELKSKMCFFQNLATHFDGILRDVHNSTSDRLQYYFVRLTWWRSKDQNDVVINWSEVDSVQEVFVLAQIHVSELLFFTKTMAPPHRCGSSGWWLKRCAAGWSQSGRSDPPLLTHSAPGSKLVFYTLGAWALVLLNQLLLYCVFFVFPVLISDCLCCDFGFVHPFCFLN